MKNLKLYHVVVKSIKTGKKTYMTVDPVSHKEGCTILSKLTKHAERLEQLEAVLTNKENAASTKTKPLVPGIIIQSRENIGTENADSVSAVTKTKRSTTMATKKEAAAKKATPKATPKKAAEPIVTQEELLTLGEEMNTLLFPGEEVDFSEMSADEITAQIKADAENIDGKDQFSDDSKATLAAIGIEIEWAKLTPTQREKAAVQKDTLAKKAAAAKKEAPAKKEKATGEKRQPPVHEKEAAPAKKESAVKEDTYTRSHALLDALKASSGTTRESIVAESNKLFMKNGGTDNMNVANYMFGYVVPSLQILGVVAKDGKNFRWTK
jgi:hypothetical protein